MKSGRAGVWVAKSRVQWTAEARGASIPGAARCRGEEYNEGEEVGSDPARLVRWREATAVNGSPGRINARFP
jgi:hypothetical protein